MPQKLPEIEITNVRPLFSLRRLAQFFDLYTEDRRPATDSILEWWHTTARCPNIAQGRFLAS
jgi:hypothetical protein